MRFKIVFLSFTLLSCLNYFAQTDSVQYNPGAKMNDGIYLSYEDFRWNKTIAKSEIVSDQDKDQLEFIGKIVFNEKFSYTRQRSTRNR